MNRQALLTRDLMQHREHQAEAAAFGRRTPDKPAPRWLVYTLTMTAVAWEFVTRLIPWLRAVLA